MAQFLAQRWRRQPQGPVAVDWGNPLARGLLGAWSPVGIDHARGVAATSLSATRRGSRLGRVLSFSGGSEVAQFGSYSVGVDAYTAFTLLIPNFASSSNSRQGIWHFQTSVGSVQDRLRLIYLDAANGFYLDTNAGYAFRTAPTFVAGDSLMLCVRKSPGPVCDFFVNNVKLATTQVVFSGELGGPSGNVQLWLGDDVESSTGWRLDGGIAFHVHWTRALHDAEIAEATANPYQLFRAPRPIIYSLPSSTVPVLSAATAIDIGSTSARPRVTITI